MPARDVRHPARRRSGTDTRRRHGDRVDRCCDRRRDAASTAASRARPQRSRRRSSARRSRARPTRACASCAGCIYAAILADRRRGRAVAVRRHLNRVAASLLASGAHRRRDHRLRRPPDAGELRRRDHARDHAAAARRRLGHVRGQLRRRSRTCGSTTRSCARASEQRIVIPNERLAGGILRNDTLGVDARRRSTSSVWLRARRPTPTRALDGARATRPAPSVTVAEATPEGMRLAVGGEPRAAARARARARRSCARAACGGCTRKACSAADERAA